MRKPAAGVPLPGLLEALGKAAPPGNTFEISASIGELPLFNPDIETPSPAPVAAFLAQVAAADVIVAASPEYAHGVAGVLKNALDWLVGFLPFAYKPVVLLKPSHRAFHSDNALREILVTMKADLIVPAWIRIEATGFDLTAAELARTPPFSDQLAWAWRCIEARRST